jgi:hypothetical protein
MLDPTEEGLHGAVYAQYHILQDLAVDFGVLWHRLLDVG